MKFLLALASVFVGTVNAEVESGTSPELTTSSMLSALASGSVSAFGNMEAALLNQPYPENFECIELDQYYGSCPYKCDCDTTRTMIMPDGRVVVIYMACGDLFSPVSYPDHCYFPTPGTGRATGGSCVTGRRCQRGSFRQRTARTAKGLRGRRTSINAP